MINKKTTLLYAILFMLHLLHSFLERKESASFISNWYQNYDTYYYLEISALVAALSVFILYLVGVKWSYYLSMVYFVIMIINGLYHITSIIIEGKSFENSSGSIITSIGFILIGILLIQSLKKDKSKLYVTRN